MRRSRSNFRPNRSECPERVQRVEGLLAQVEWCYRLEVYFVYILRTTSKALYIGVTQNLEQRLAAHYRGKGAMWIRSRTFKHPGQWTPAAR